MHWIISIHLQDEFEIWIDFSAKQQSQVYCQGNSIGTKRRKIKVLDWPNQSTHLNSIDNLLNVLTVMAGYFYLNTVHDLYTGSILKLSMQTKYLSHFS